MKDPSLVSRFRNGLHPKAASQQPLVVPPPLPVGVRTPDPLAELGSGSGNALVSALVINYRGLKRSSNNSVILQKGDEITAHITNRLRLQVKRL